MISKWSLPFLALLQTVTSQIPTNYTDDGFLLQGYLSTPPNASPTNKLPAVIIIPDWDGVNEYEQTRSRMLSDELGYVGFAADIYGVDLQEDLDIDTRREQAGLYRGNETLFVGRMQAAVALIKELEYVNPDAIGMIGYCFGGTGVLMYALTGQDDVQAVVSFHGGLTSLPNGTSDVIPKVLVLSGGDDDTSTAIADLEETLNDANATWEITRYADIEHAFTVFDDERYDLRADTRSWDSMQTFLEEAFGISSYPSFVPPENLIEAVSYTDEEFELQGYLSIPTGVSSSNKAPAVIIIPDWDGVNEYEQIRARMLADLGYVGFAADIYGVDLQEGLNFTTRFDQATLYRSDPELFVGRMKAAVTLVRGLEYVDTDSIALIGYCFGGTGVLVYAMTGQTDVQTIVSFHGGLTSLPDVNTTISPNVLVLSGGDDDTSTDVADLEDALGAGNATWEISRYAFVEHAFTVFGNDQYNLRADTRSWESMQTFLKYDGHGPPEGGYPMPTDPPTPSPTDTPGLLPIVPVTPPPSDPTGYASESPFPTVSSVPTVSPPASESADPGGVEDPTTPPAIAPGPGPNTRGSGPEETGSMPSSSTRDQSNGASRSLMNLVGVWVCLFGAVVWGVMA